MTGIDSPPTSLQVVVTGACGSLGQALIRRLAAAGRLTSVDGTELPLAQILGVDPIHRAGLFVDDRVEYVRGDIESATLMSHVMSGKTDSVFHLATTPAGEVADDADAIARDLDALRTLLAAANAQRRPPKIVYASSYAAASAPATGHGTRDAIAELLLADASRRGRIDARIVRLPLLLGTGFEPLDQMLREALAQRATVCPIAEACPLQAASVAAAATALIVAHEQAPTARGIDRVLALPALATTAGALLQALATVHGEAVRRLVAVEPDLAIEELVRATSQNVGASNGLPGAVADAETLVRQFAG